MCRGPSIPHPLYTIHPRGWSESHTPVKTVPSVIFRMWSVIGSDLLLRVFLENCMKFKKEFAHSVLSDEWQFRNCLSSNYIYYLSYLLIGNFETNSRQFFTNCHLAIRPTFQNLINGNFVTNSH